MDIEPLSINTFYDSAVYRSARVNHTTPAYQINEFLANVAINRGAYLKRSGTGNSVQAFIAEGFVVLSSITGGSVSFEYTVDSEELVEADTASWYKTSLLDITDDIYFFIKSTIYIRVVAAEGVSWTIEFRSVI